MKRWWLSFLTSLLIAGVFATLVQASDPVETEPNDTPAQADLLNPSAMMQASITPAGDQDYYVIPGINTTWGFIALLDTHNSTSSDTATLTALGSDGTTVLQSDSGSWENGAGIALQNYANDSASLYLKVNETGNDSTISTYSLVHYQTIVSPQAEVEPNNDRLTGTPSSFTMSGILSSNTDVDCYQFHGRQDDSILIALKSGSGSTADYELTLLDPTGASIASAKSYRRKRQ